MPVSESSTIVILLAACAGLSVLLLLLAFRILARLATLEQRIISIASAQEEGGQAPSSAETSQGGAFESFLNEDPSRRDLIKSEQFAAYRRWRQENGLNWSNK